MITKRRNVLVALPKLIRFQNQTNSLIVLKHKQNVLKIFRHHKITYCLYKKYVAFQRCQKYSKTSA